LIDLLFTWSSTCAVFTDEEERKKKVYILIVPGFGHLNPEGRGGSVTSQSQIPRHLSLVSWSSLRPFSLFR